MSSRRLSLLGWLCGALALSFAASADAQEATRARLLTELDAATFNEHFPAVALATGVSGRVFLSCNVAADGASSCEAAEDSPAGLGFGAAAVAVSRGWTFAPAQENGRAVASVRRLTIVFQNEVPTRQILQGTLFVDAIAGSSAPQDSAGPTLTNETREALSCSWSGRFCWSNASSSGLTREDQNAGYYPPAARTAGFNGRALVACAIRADRHADCGVETETSPGQEFGAYAVRLVSDVATSLNLEPGAVFRVPVQFAVHPANQRPRSPEIWERRPTAFDFEQYFPMEALANEHEGRTILICEIMANRHLNCAGGFEDPVGEGFGQAAAAISRSFVLSPEFFGTPGYAEGERIRIPITFRIG